MLQCTGRMDNPWLPDGTGERGPVSRHTFFWRWDAGQESWGVRDGNARQDLHSPPTGFQTVFENRLIKEMFFIPTWPEDQVECLKRAFSEVIRARHGRAPRTTDMHCEVGVPLNVPGEMAWVRVDTCETWPVRAATGVRIVFDNEPQFMDNINWPVWGWAHDVRVRILDPPSVDIL